jgi:hypothetical protein
MVTFNQLIQCHIPEDGSTLHIDCHENLHVCVWDRSFTCQAVSHRFPTTVAQVRAQSGYVDKVELRQVFLIGIVGGGVQLGPLGITSHL